MCLRFMPPPPPFLLLVVVLQLLLNQTNKISAYDLGALIETCAYVVALL